MALLLLGSCGLVRSIPEPRSDDNDLPLDNLVFDSPERVLFRLEAEIEFSVIKNVSKSQDIIKWDRISILK